MWDGMVVDVMPFFSSNKSNVKLNNYDTLGYRSGSTAL